MSISKLQMVSTAEDAVAVRRASKNASDIVADESEWCVPPCRYLPPAAGERMIATRWRAFEERVRETSAVTPEDCHVIGIALRSMNLRFSVSGRTLFDGAAMPGTPLVVGPGAAVGCIFRGPCDELHLYAPNRLIAECARDMTGCQPDAICSDTTPVRDPTLERLGWALLTGDDIGGAVGELYVDCLGMAIVARLLSVARGAAPHEQAKVTPLPRWRLKRAIDYVEARLSGPVSLADLAAATGLTRMHFAAQFRAATGLRPHEYLLRRRIERSQELLLRRDICVVDVALSVGFQTQSHFTTVFKRFVGQPPLAWRQSQGLPDKVREAERRGSSEPSENPSRAFMHARF